MSEFERNLKQAEKEFNKIGQDVKKFQKSLDGLTATSRKTSQEQKAHNIQLKSTASQYDKAEKEVNELRKKLIDTAEATGENSEETAKLAKELSKAEKRSESLKREVDRLSKEMDEGAESAKKFGQSTNQSLDSAKTGSISLSGVLNGLKIGFDVFASGIKAAAKAIEVAFDTASLAIKGTITATAAATTAVATYAKTAYTAYSEYQQLVGGVDTLFKENSVDVQKYADEAYKTAGMSANAYMDNVVKFSASLLQGLNNDTEMAAKKANLAIQDMSDNANKFGSDITSIQNAYQGFAKQNYMMLDNLRLGYGGTASEMARLVNDAMVFYKTVDEGSVKEVPFHTLIDAIHVVQDRMGITGTTAKEAEYTLAGSVGSMVASWKNLTTEVSKPKGNIAVRFEEFITAAKAAKKNVVPAIRNAFTGIRTLIREAVPVIVEEIPKLISELLPRAIHTGTALMKGLSEVAETLITSFSETLEIKAYSSSKAFGGLISSVIKAIGKSLPSIARSIKSSLRGLIDGLNIKELAKVVTDTFLAAPELLSMFTTAIPKMLSEFGTILQESGNIKIVTSSILEMLKNVLNVVTDTIPIVVPLVFEALRTVFIELAKYIPQIIPQVTTLLLEIIDVFTRPEIRMPLLKAGETLLFALVDGFVNSAPLIGARMPLLVNQLSTSLTEEAVEMTKSGAALSAYTLQGILDFSEPIRTAGHFIVGEVVGGITEFFDKIRTKGMKLLFEFLEGIRDGVFKIAETVKGIFNEFSIKFGENSHWAKNWGSDLVDNFVQGVKDNLYKVVAASSKMAGTVYDYLHFSKPDKGPLADFDTYGPDMVDLFVKGIDSNQSKLIESVRGMAANVRGSFGFGTPALSLAVAGNGMTKNTSPIVLNVEKLVEINGVTNIKDVDFEEISDRAVESIARKLERLGISTNRAKGGPGWI